MTKLKQLAVAYTILDHAQRAVIEDDDAWSILFDAQREVANELKTLIKQTPSWIESVLDYVLSDVNNSPVIREISRTL